MIEARARTGAFVLVLWAVPAAAAAQAATLAVVRGEVRDSSRQAVGGAVVTLRDTADEALATTQTDGGGRFVLLDLAPGGPYMLEVEHPTRSATARRTLHLAAGETRRVSILLGSGPIRLPGIRVVTGAELTFSGRPTGAATVVEEREIRSLPSIDRDIVAFTALSPMASIDEGAISVAGQNTRFNALRIDGALFQDVFGLSPTGVPGGQANARPLPIDAVRRYSVLVAPYDVRQSGFTGALLEATTRSAGEQWEGAVFAYYRDAAFSGTSAEPDLLGGRDRGPSPDFRTRAAGFRLGGPIGAVRVLAAGEVERRQRPLPGLHVGQAHPLRVRLLPDTLARLVQILEDRYGFGAGHASSYGLENPLGNLFLRLDVPLSQRHELSAQYTMISASEDVGARHLGFGPYELSSAGTTLESRTHAVAARHAIRLGDRTSNHLLLSLRRTDDATVSASPLPLVQVQLEAMSDGHILRRPVQAGGNTLAHDNALEQTVLQVSNNLSHVAGDHLLTVGAEGRWLGIRRRYLPSSRGIWRFDSLDALERNDPASFERLLLDAGASPSVELSVLQIAAFLQDEWVVSPTLSLTLGLRFDLPLEMGRPLHNAELERLTGIATDRKAASGLMLSPRAGFNWSPAIERRIEIRGGVGLFSGRPPMAWIADAYANTGLRTALLICEGDAAPILQPDAPPATCADGTGSTRRDVTFFDDDFRYPQDLRASLGVDWELPWGLAATVETVFTRALHQVAIEDINLPAGVAGPLPTEEGYPKALGDRPVFGTPRLIPDQFGPLFPDRRWPEYGSVLRIGDRSGNAAVAIAADLQRRLATRFDFRLAYSYTRSVDTRSLMFLDAALNYGLTPIRGDPGRPERRHSAFGRPHRVLGSVRARLAEWGDGLDATLLYIGQSGLPYSYVYETDMNGDGFPGPGARAEAYNDLFNVPALPHELPTAIVSSNMIFQLAALDPCLQAASGGIIARNTCRTPWSNRLDLRLSQAVDLPFGRVRFTGDLMNALNLLNAGWGLVHVVPPVVPILRIDRRQGCPGRECHIGNELVGSYTGPSRRDPETGLGVADLPYTLSLPDSRWRAQIGLRLEF
ncbi:MAG: carboxypeptidase regulatory-like domain-containing protein [Longimicrobiales bacterium]